MNHLAASLDTLRPKFENDLFEWLSIPSVSADSRHSADVVRAADWLLERLSQLGLAAEKIERSGHPPLVYAESAAVPGKPTVLVYGHYDVQPPDPLEEWRTPPFQPSVRDGKVFARGATDDKGQFLTHLQSVAAWRSAGQELPLQIKFLVEGEEEVGSEHLEQYLREQRRRLACDCVVISDTSQFGPGRPAITYGLRGIAYYELQLSGPAQDLHSGVFGGAVTNPANSLAMLLSALVDGRGRIQIPGFYQDVVPLTVQERKQFQQLEFDEEEFQRQIGVPAVAGEEGYSTLERRWARPSCDVHGLTSGYQGEGAKTVLPARASAKLSFRLVPRQDPQQITKALREFLQARLPDGVTMALIDYHGAPGVLVPLESPYIQAAAKAIEEGFGTPPVMIREGGSIPIVTSFGEVLGADVLLLGWGQNDDNAHSPNEKFSLADYHRGIRASCALWAQLAERVPDSDT